LSHGGILALSNAIYWDDWSLYKVDPELITDMFNQAGALFNWTSKLHNSLLLIGPFTYKVITFFLMLATSYLFEIILRRDFALKTSESLLILLLFLILPFNTARVALINLPYTLGYFLFFLAWYFIYKNKFLSLIFFFFSFNTNSLLVFYALPIIGIFYKEIGNNGYKNIIQIGGKYILFIILPFIFFYIKTTYFKPHGIYENYNSLNGINYLNNIATALSISFQDIILFFLKFNKLFIYTFTLSFIVFLPLRNYQLLVNIHKERATSFIFLGIIAIIFASFPYLILGLAPTFLEWSSRHQLLLPFGASLLLVGIISFLNPQFKLFILIFVVLTSIAINITNYVALYQDWNKQKALIMLFKSNDEIKNAGIVGFIDETKSLNAINRTYRIYEWNGLMKAAFGDEIRFGIEGTGFEWARERGDNIDFVNASNNNKDFINDGKKPTLIVRILPANDGKKLYTDFFNKNAVKIETEHPEP
jgi:hypothetical protein